MNPAAEVFGQGVGFAVRVGDDGRVTWSMGPESVRESIEIVLATEPGERLMRPGFGAGLRRFLFEPNTPETHRLIEERIVGALERSEPRLRLDEVRVTANPLLRSEAVATIRYRLVATSEPARVDVAVPVAAGGP